MLHHPDPSDTDLAYADGFAMGHETAMQTILRQAEIRSLPNIVANLLEASKILYHHLSFDGHGHEVLQKHMRDGQQWLEWIQGEGYELNSTFNTK